MAASLVGAHVSARAAALLRMDIKAIQELLGHAFLSSTSGYVHVRSDHVERAWNNANHRVEARLGLDT